MNALLLSSFNIYIVPPVLFILFGLTLTGLALSRRPLTRENVVFAVLCLLYCMLEPVFIVHQLTDDQTLILKIERTVHFAYVYIPAVQVLFFHTILGLRRPKITAACFLTSFLVSLTTQTDWYFTGLHHYSWGFIAKGNWAFDFFGIYGLTVLVYNLKLISTAFNTQLNPLLRRKLGYMFSGFILTGVLLVFNIPAIKGIDLYPLGNFGFVPLAVLGYGVIKHRLLDVRTVIHRTVLWLLVSALVLIPNVIFLFWIRHQIASVNPRLLVLFFSIWFFFNYIHIIKVQRIINRVFNKNRMALKLAASRLIDEIVHLKGMEELIKEVCLRISRVLEDNSVDFFIRKTDANIYASSNGRIASLQPELEACLVQGETMYDRHLLETYQGLGDMRTGLISLMDKVKCSYLVPLAGNDQLNGFYTLGNVSDDRLLTVDQIEFVVKTAGPLSIAVANAVMFERLSELKDELENKTDELTQEIIERRRKQRQIQKVKAELEQANRALEKAILQANEMTARAEKTNYILQLEIKERQKVEAALRQSEEKYRLIAENTTDVIWTAGLDLKPTYISPSVKQLRGLTVEEAMAEPIERSVTKETLDKATSILATELENERRVPGYRAKSLVVELEMYCKDGSTVWTEMTCSLLRDEKGRPKGLLGVIRDISDRKKAEEELRFAAFHDILTGMHNRAAFMQQLGHDIEYAKRYNNQLALLFIDLDKFKRVNDTYGHEIGDLLLQDVAQRISSSVRKTDFVSRLGGDEFTVILNSPRQILPEVVAARISESIRQPYKYGKVDIRFIDSSIGVGIFPEDGQDVETLLKKADAKMYEEKRRRKYDLSDEDLSKTALG